MTNEGQPSLAQLFLIGVEAAVPRKRLFGGDYYEFGIVAMLATHVFERGVMLGMARADYGRALAALVLPAEQVERFFQFAASSIAERQRAIGDEQVGLSALFTRTEFPELLGLEGVSLSIHDPTAFERLTKKKVRADETISWQWSRYFAEGLAFGALFPEEVRDMLARERQDPPGLDGTDEGHDFLGGDISGPHVSDLDLEVEHVVETTRQFVEAYAPDLSSSLGW